MNVDEIVKEIKKDELKGLIEILDNVAVVKMEAFKNILENKYYIRIELMEGVKHNHVQELSEQIELRGFSFKGLSAVNNKIYAIFTYP